MIDCWCSASQQRRLVNANRGDEGILGVHARRVWLSGQNKGDMLPQLFPTSTQTTSGTRKSQAASAPAFISSTGTKSSMHHFTHRPTL